MAKTETTETTAASYTIQEAALRMGKTVRTVQRLLATGQLSKAPDGRIPAELVDEMADAAADEVDMGAVLRELRLSLANSNAHVLAMSKQLLETVQGSNSALAAENARLAEQNTEFQGIHLQSLGIIGEVLMKQEERRAIAAEAEQNAALRARGFEMLVQWAPKLAEQLDGSAKIRKVVEDLTDEEAGILEMAAGQVQNRDAAKFLQDLLKARKGGAA